MALLKIDYLKLEDLRVGMLVNARQLDRIYDVYIILANTELIQFKNKETAWAGVISEISERPTCATEEDEVLIYNSSLKAMENGTYEK